MKPQTLDGYHADFTGDCERMLVTLLRGLGPWKDSIVLVGGLTPRYLVKARPPEVPEHAGTQDVDVVVALQVLADVEAYHTLEDNLKKLGFERGTNAQARPINWRWEVRAGNALLRLEFLADMPDMKRVEPLPTTRNLSALNVPHSSIAKPIVRPCGSKESISDRCVVISSSIRRALSSSSYHWSVLNSVALGPAVPQ